MTKQTIKTRKSKHPSAQKYLDIMEIKDDCVILRDGSLRGVVLVSSVNFALKSGEEQDALIEGYVGFLNTLTDFPIQIVVQSRPLNIDGYIAKIEEVKKSQENELMRIQTADYLEFIKELVKMGQIMNKKFFIVVPYNPMGDRKINFFTRLMSVFSPVGAVRLGRTRFNKYKVGLYKRINFVRGGLQSMGLNSAVLNTQSLIELFYNIYNPATAVQEPAVEPEKVGVED